MEKYLDHSKEKFKNGKSIQVFNTFKNKLFTELNIELLNDINEFNGIKNTLLLLKDITTDKIYEWKVTDGFRRIKELIEKERSGIKDYRKLANNHKNALDERKKYYIKLFLSHDIELDCSNVKVFKKDKCILKCLKTSNILELVLGKNIEPRINEYVLKVRNNKSKFDITIIDRFDNIKEKLESFDVKVLDNKEDFTGISNFKFNLYCNKTGKEFKIKFDGGKINKDEIIFEILEHHRNNKPTEEDYICNFIKSLNVDIVQTNRQLIKPLELDIVCEIEKIAIEYNGLRWHSESNGKDKNYHLNKTLLCEAQGYRLLHIFENEWNNKQEIVKSIIKAKLNKIDNKIYARKCIIKEIDSKEKTNFLNANHIQGDCVSKHNIGLYYKDELVCLMTFGKRNIGQNTDKHIELLRFCNKLDTRVIGGSSRLLKYFEKIYKPESLLSYADRRYSNGGMYKKLGFTFDHFSIPGYWYIHRTRNEFKHRSNFMKHKLKDLLKKYDENLTEYENMFNNGYEKIWDCGQYVFIKKYS